MSAFAFIPVEPEEFAAHAAAMSQVLSPTSSTKPNFYAQSVAAEKKERSKSFFTRSLDYIKGLFGRDTETYTVEEMDHMIEYFHRAILFLQQEKVDKMKKQ